MNEFYQQEHEQQEKLSNQSTTEMTTFYPSTRNHPLTTKQLTDHDNKNGMYKDAFVVQAIQHWKSETLDHQQSKNNQISQPFINQPSSTQTSNINTISNLSNKILSSHTDKNSNKDELLTIVDESEKPITTMKKRVRPIPASYIRRRFNLKNNSISNESSYSKLVTHNNKNKLGGTRTTRKKSTKSAPIFIAPKKTSPQPPSFSTLSFDDSRQIKRKPTLKRQSAFVDDQNSSSMTTWTQVPSTTPIRTYTHSSSTSQDESSSDESDHESLIIRKKNSKIKDQQFHSSFPINTKIPSAIFITDPYGHSHTFDPNNDLQEKDDPNEQISDDDSNPNDTNTLCPTSTFDNSSSPDIVIIPPTPILDKHTLHSIGEEDEEEIEDNHDDGNIFAKLNRIEASTRSRQTNLNVQKKENDQIQNKIDKEPLGRRWSDGFVDKETEQISSPQSSLIKIPSAASIIKQTENPPVKLSKTKYLLMKLHLISSNKDDESNTSSSSSTTTTNPPPKKRTVRRSTDKKHSHDKLSPTDDSNSGLNTHLRESSNTIVPDIQIQRTILTTDNINTENNSSHYDNNKQTKPEKLDSIRSLNVADTDDDDIDGTFEKAKLGSQTSINSVSSDTKARYGLDVSGTIQLKITYTLTTGALDIFIIKCTNLARPKRYQTSDPFVKIYLLPDRSKNSKRKTATKKDTTEPIFEEKFRYHVTKQEFETRVLWISVWNQAQLGTNDFLGEINIPLANCILDKTEEYQLLAHMKKQNFTPHLATTMESGEIQFQLTFLENPVNKDLGTLQVHYIEAKAIYYGKHDVDAICQGLLMPDNIKRKLPTIRKGPSPKWEIPLRWEGIRRDNLKNTSIEISIWCQEFFRKIMLGFVRLNLSQGHFDNKPVKWLDSTSVEKSAWETFLRKPTQIHRFRLPLRPGIIENK